MYLQISNRPGDVYVIDEERILIYGVKCIALTLGSRNVENLQQAIRERQVKDEDLRGSKFIITYNERQNRFRLDISKGPTVFVDGNQLINSLENFYQATLTG